MNIVDALVVTLGLDSSGFDRGQKNASDNLGRMSSDAKRTQQSFDSMASSMAASSNAMQNSMAGLPVLLHEIYGAIVRMTEQVTGVKQMTLSLEDFNGLAEQAAKDAREAAGAMGELGDAANDSADNINDAGGSIDDVSEKTRRLGEAGSKMGKAFGRSGDQMARSLRGVANELLGVLALSKGGSFLGGQVVDSITSQADVGRQSVNLGMNPRDLKAWESVSELYGGNADEARQTIGGIRQSVYDNIYKGAEVPQWARMLGIQLDNGTGGMRDMEGIMADIFDGLKNLSPDDQSYVSQQLIGLSPSFANMAHKGGANLHGELAAARERSELTDEGVANAQKFQRESIESLQSLAGAWNKFIGENAPALTEAMKGLTSEVMRFGSDIKRNVDEYSHHTEDHYSGLEGWDKGAAYTADVIVGTLSGGDAEKGYEINKKLTELINPGKKQSRDGILYDPSALEGGPDDSKWNSLWYPQKRNLESKIQERDAGKMPSVWKDNPELRAYDEAIWAEHQKRLDWEKKQTELIEKNGYKSVYPARPEESQIKTGQSSPHLPSGVATFGKFGSSTSTTLPQSSAFDAMRARIIKQESGGQDYWQYDDPKGRWKKGDPVRSEVGALYSRQVMPATANAPGFGILPARDNSPEEYNRVGDELMRVLFNRYNGDIDKAMAAYHSGYAFVDRLVAKADKSGGDWRTGLGPKGRDYIGYKPPSREEQRAVAGMQKVMEGVRDAQSMMGKGQQQPMPVVSPQLRAQTSPAMSPGVQQAMSNDNRTITSTTATHIDSVNVHVPGGNSKEIAGGIGSALQRHPLINGANYA